MRSDERRRVSTPTLAICILVSIPSTSCRHPSLSRNVNEAPPSPRPHSEGEASSSRHADRRTTAQSTGARDEARAVLRSQEGSHLATIFGSDSLLGEPNDTVLGGLVGTQSGESYGVGGLGLAHESGYARSGHYGLFAQASHLAARPLRLRLDPNGRYATTYRPGGAALAAFDAAVTRGAIPSSYRTLVGDFGVRYAPPIAPPDEAALAFRVDLGRASLPPDGGRVPLRIAMRSSAHHPLRARLAVHLVLDNSGSMAGEAIANARRAAETLVGRLADDDDFSLVLFSGDAHLLVESGRVGPRRAKIVGRISGIGIDGSTNKAAGLDLGYAQARARSDEDAVRIVMLLSDGHANIGDTDPAGLAARAAGAFQAGIQTSAFGLGPDYDARLMSSIADQGAGGYYYLADSSQISLAITQELDARLVPVAQAVELRVRLAPDIKPLKVYGSHQLDETDEASVRRQEVAVDRQSERRDGIVRDRQRDDRGGMRFFIPTFAAGDRHAMLIDLVVPRGAGNRSLGTVEIRYKDRLRKDNVVKEIPLHVSFATSAAESAATVDRSVAATAEAFAAGDAILDAAERIETGNAAAAIDRLSSAAARMTSASLRLDDIRLSADARRLANLVTAIQAGSTAALPLAVLLRGSGYGYLH